MVGDPLCQFLDAIGAPRTQRHRCAFLAEKAGLGFAESAARAGDDDDFSSDSIVHIRDFR
jgi:hypothetical protein